MFYLQREDARNLKLSYVKLLLLTRKSYTKLMVCLSDGLFLNSPSRIIAEILRQHAQNSQDPSINKAMMIMMARMMIMMMTTPSHRSSS